jgi:hypothetical protein
MTPAMHLHAIMASYAHNKLAQQIRYDLERAYALGQEFGIERAAQVVDHCNKEGPYNAIGAATRIRSLLVRGPSEPVRDISEDFAP